jgi:hypothetical protein
VRVVHRSKAPHIGLCLLHRVQVAHTADKPCTEQRISLLGAFVVGKQEATPVQGSLICFCPGLPEVKGEGLGCPPGSSPSCIRSQLDWRSRRQPPWLTGWSLTSLPAPTVRPSVLRSIISTGTFISPAIWRIHIHISVLAV